MPLPEEIIARSETCVCRYCGGALEPALIVYNKYGGHGIELFCKACHKTDKGVEKEIYAWAKDFVVSSGFDYFTEDDSLDKQGKNIAKVCEMLVWCSHKNLENGENPLRKALLEG